MSIIDKLWLMKHIVLYDNKAHLKSLGDITLRVSRDMRLNRNLEAFKRISVYDTLMLRYNNLSELLVMIESYTRQIEHRYITSSSIYARSKRKVGILEYVCQAEDNYISPITAFKRFIYRLNAFIGYVNKKGIKPEPFLNNIVEEAYTLTKSYYLFSIDAKAMEDF